MDKWIPGQVEPSLIRYIDYMSAGYKESTTAAAQVQTAMLAVCHVEPGIFFGEKNIWSYIDWSLFMLRKFYVMGRSRDCTENQAGVGTMAVDWIGFAYAALLAVGGVVGYTRKGSKISLAAGLTFGSVAGYGAYCVTRDPRNVKISLFSAFLLTIIMGMRFKRSKKLMPAGLVACLSHIRVLPGFQVIELVCYGRQIEMTAGHIKCGSFHPEAELQAISEELNCHVP
ncbi:hypothetical protein Q9233_004499 [Columba guinea]|nr:hypothetical protein Q9233_004499 [Columba guinea]